MKQITLQIPAKTYASLEVFAQEAGFTPEEVADLWLRLAARERQASQEKLNSRKEYRNLPRRTK